MTAREKELTERLAQCESALAGSQRANALLRQKIDLLVLADQPTPKTLPTIRYSKAFQNIPSPFAHYQNGDGFPFESYPTRASQFLASRWVLR